MAQGFGYGAGVGLLQGISMGHGIQMDRAANERANENQALREAEFLDNREWTKEARGMEREQFGWQREGQENAQAEQQYQLEARKAQQQSLRFKQAVYGEDGKVKPASKWDRAILADIGNQMGMVKEYLAQNPDVDPDAPLLEVVPLKTGDGERISFRLRRTDGGAGVLTKNRSSAGDDQVVTLAPEEFVGEMEDIFAGYGVGKPQAPKDPLEAERFKRETELMKIREKGGQDRRTDAAKPGSDEAKNLFTNLPEDVKSMLGDAQRDELTGKVEFVLDPERVNSFLSFWKNESGEADPRKAVTTFQDAEKINTSPAAEIVKEINANPGKKNYLLKLTTPEKRAEIRAYLNGESSNDGLMPSHGRGIQ